MRDAGLIAIVHSKVIVIDPFSNDCAAVTGSQNFSVSASEKNDENLVIVRGNKKITQSYALHINGVYDHYSWRAFLANGGNPDQIYKPLDGWMPSGARAQELDFWMNDPAPLKLPGIRRPAAHRRNGLWIEGKLTLAALLTP